MSDEKTTTLEDLWAFAKSLFGRQNVVLIAAIAVIAFVTLRARQSLAEDSKAVLDAGVAAETKKREELQTAFDEHLKDDREFKREVLRRLDENSADNRALYKTVLTGEKQYRLERPIPSVPDGGP